MTMSQILLGIFFNVHSAVLIEDVPFTEEDFKGGPEKIHHLYEQVSYNCFIAAGLYVLLGGLLLLPGPAEQAQGVHGALGGAAAPRPGPRRDPSIYYSSSLAPLGLGVALLVGAVPGPCLPPSSPVCGRLWAGGGGCHVLCPPVWSAPLCLTFKIPPSVVVHPLPHLSS
ncbi:unnamed protein product [Eretmochelys imbricata]